MQVQVLPPLPTFVDHSVLNLWAFVRAVIDPSFVIRHRDRGQPCVLAL